MRESRSSRRVTFAPCLLISCGKGHPNGCPPRSWDGDGAGRLRGSADGAPVREGHEEHGRHDRQYHGVTPTFAAGVQGAPSALWPLGWWGMHGTPRGEHLVGAAFFRVARRGHRIDARHIASHRRGVDPWPRARGNAAWGWVGAAVEREDGQQGPPYAYECVTDRFPAKRHSAGGEQSGPTRVARELTQAEAAARCGGCGRTFDAAVAERGGDAARQGARRPQHTHAARGLLHGHPGSHGHAGDGGCVAHILTHSVTAAGHGRPCDPRFSAQIWFFSFVWAGLRRHREKRGACYCIRCLSRAARRSRVWALRPSAPLSTETAVFDLGGVGD